MRRRLRDNSLGLVTISIFLVLLGMQAITGYRSYNAEQREHDEAAIGFRSYLTSSHIVEATFENWESEFLQMSAYVVLTAMLVQRGSAESNDPDGPCGSEPVTREQREQAPWPVRRGGIALTLYRHSLSGALFLLFLLSFALHAWGGAHLYSEDQMTHGQPGISVWMYLRTAHFWFESFQNWQSEFLAVFALAVLSIFLRDEGSAESKPLAAPHSQTGG